MYKNQTLSCIFGIFYPSGRSTRCFQEFSTEDNADLFYEENMAKKREDEEKARRAQLAVPGLVNPHDRPEDDMADL